MSQLVQDAPKIAKATISAMMQEGSSSDDCTDLAATTIKEVEDAVAAAQEILDHFKEHDGSQCLEEGKSSLDEAESALSTAQKASEDAAAAAAEAASATIDFTGVPLASLSESEGGLCGLPVTTPAYTAAKATAESTATAASEASAAIAGFEAALESAKTAAAELVANCQCETYTTYTEAWTTAESHAEENAASWAKGKHMQCVLAGTDPASCDVGTCPTVTAVTLAEGATEAACHGGGGSAACENVEFTPSYSDCSASSTFLGDAMGTSHGKGRLDSSQAWSAESNTVGQWYQMDLGSVKSVGGVVTQGRHDAPWNNQMVTSFSVKVSSDNAVWTDVDGGHVFTGNTVAGDAKVTSTFASPVDARFVRIVVQSWTNHVSLRAGVSLCSGM